jgi:hypothetical protein
MVVVVWDYDIPSLKQGSIIRRRKKNRNTKIMNGRKGTEGLTAPQPGEDTNPKKLQLNFGSAKALAALCLPSTIF